jgi:hypothetical protein
MSSRTGYLLGMIAALMLASSGAKAEKLTGWYIVNPVIGNDATCAFQPLQIPSFTQTTCKTMTRACDLAGSQPFVRVGLSPMPTGTFYVENVVCRATGTAAAPLLIIGQGPGSQMHGKDPTKPVLEMTGSYVHWGKIEFLNNVGSADAVYIHGVDAAHPSHGVQMFYNTVVTHNGGVGVHIKYSDDAIVQLDTIADNAIGGILVENSKRFIEYHSSIYNGTPRPGTYGVKAINSPGLCYQENLKQSGEGTNVILASSPNSALLSNGPITKLITPTSDITTDIISDTLTNVGACINSP